MSKLGFSVYVSAFPQQQEMLEEMAGTNALIFTSFHIQEEFSDNFVAQATEMCAWLKANGFRIIADVSPKTLDIFGHTSIINFASEMNLDILRLDYGFELEEMLAVAREFPIAFNASTVDRETASSIVNNGGEVYGMHNFYPRPETGLDKSWFHKVNREFTDLGLKVLAFIPGDKEKRGPIQAGLPTLESHRLLPPYVSYLDLAVNFDVHGIFVGDISISEQQLQLIQQHQEGITALPAQLAPEHQDLYGKVFTIRPDSPLMVKRLQESREYSCPGKQIKPGNCTARANGSITMDNELYGRYSGEIQILAGDYPQDDRVNVIGSINSDYLDALNCLPNGSKIKLVRL